MPGGNKRTKAAGLAASAGLHLAVVLLLSIGVARIPPPPPPPSTAMTVSFVDGSAPPSPAPPTSQSQQPIPVTTDPTPQPSDDPQPTPVAIAPATPEPTSSDPPAQATTSPDQPIGGAHVAIGVKASGGDLNPDLAASVAHSVMARIANCWQKPSNAPSGQTSIVRVRFAPDGSLQSAPQVIRLVDQTETSVTSPNPWEEAAVDAIRRCSPLGLPAGLYPYWGVVDVQVFS